MHENKERTIPCRVAYCGPLATCAGCDMGMSLTWRGFVPYYRRADSRPCCVVIHEEQFGAADGIGHLKLMMIGRGGEKYDKTWLRAHSQTERFETANAARREPQDLTLFLPTLLRCKGEITPFQFKRGPLASAATNPPQPVAEELSPESIDLKKRMAQHALKLAGADPDTPLVAGAVDGLIDRLSHPPPNGKHAKAEKK